MKCQQVEIISFVFLQFILFAVKTKRDCEAQHAI